MSVEIKVIHERTGEILVTTRLDSMEREANPLVDKYRSRAEGLISIRDTQWKLKLENAVYAVASTGFAIACLDLIINSGALTSGDIKTAGLVASFGASFWGYWQIQENRFRSRILGLHIKTISGYSDNNVEK